MPELNRRPGPSSCLPFNCFVTSRKLWFFRMQDEYKEMLAEAKETTDDLRSQVGC